MLAIVIAGLTLLLNHADGVLRRSLKDLCILGGNKEICSSRKPALGVVRIFQQNIHSFTSHVLNVPNRVAKLLNCYFECHELRSRQGLPFVKVRLRQIEMLGVSQRLLEP